MNFLLANFTQRDMFILITGDEEAQADLPIQIRGKGRDPMATKMLTKGDVEFNGQVIKLGKDYLVNGRKGRPFLAWVRDGKSNLPAGFVPQPNTTIRIKWDGTYMPSDFVSNFGRQPVIQELAPN